MSHQMGLGLHMTDNFLGGHNPFTITKSGLSVFKVTATSTNTTTTTNGVGHTHDQVTPDDFTYFSDGTRYIIVLVNVVGVCTFLSVFGICTNCVNILVFLKQGFQETINIALFALAISDLASLVFLLWQAVCMNPLFQRGIGTTVVWHEVQNVTGGWPHVLCVKVTGWLTGYVTVERCFCVVFPLKVRRILTVTRAKVIIVAIFVLVLASHAPIFYSSRLRWKFDDEKNATTFGLVLTDNWEPLQRASFIVSGFSFSLGFSFLTAVSTVILVVSLTRKSKWRQKTAVKCEKGKPATRDQRVVKMVVALATIFIICLLPPSLLSVWMMLYPELTIGGKNKNTLLVVESFCNILESVNSSANFFIYYNMSSSFQRVCVAIFGCGKKRRNTATVSENQQADRQQTTAFC